MRWIRSLRDAWFGPKEVTATLCGHRTKLAGEVTAFGESTTVTIPLNEDGSANYCLDCIGKMTIRCAWCVNPIFIGDPITLYTPRSQKDFSRAYATRQQLPFVFDSDLGFKIPAHAVVYQRKPLQLVGCMRWECADSAADRAGFWVPSTEQGKGTVYRVRTAFEEILAGKDCVVVGDLGNPSEASPLQENDRRVPVVRTIP